MQKEPESQTKKNTTTKPKSNIFAYTPFIVFALLGTLFVYALSSDDPSLVPSTLLGKPVPDFNLPALEGLKTHQDVSVPGFSSEDLHQGEVSLINVWASWCVPCRQEHPFITALAQQHDIPVYGLNQKDTQTGALNFLQELGNPYRAVGRDVSGRVSIDWGVYGVPETFVVNGQGQIIYKHIGPITSQKTVQRLIMEIKKARKNVLKE
ncbi:MAG: DsbE family thiol:disulfide interchange protein [Pseudomonadota bacterium]